MGQERGRKNVAQKPAAAMTLRTIALMVFLPFALCSPSSADVRVLDGDTLDIDGKRHRLWGIDAPELDQTCDHDWPAGRKARAFLQMLVRERQVVCRPKGTDKYNRTLSVCSVDGIDLNQAMVQSGNAWAYVRYSAAYLADEMSARGHPAGVYLHNCQPAWDWRHRKGIVK